MKKVLFVDLNTGLLGRTDVLDTADTSLTAIPGKAPIGGASGVIDASWLPLNSGSGSGDMTNPMNAAGDLIVGVAATTVNIATVNDGATGIASNGNASHPEYVMANDPGTWLSTSTGNGEWVGMSWATAQTIVAARLVQPGGWISGYMMSQYRFQSSLDLVSWMDHSANLTAQDSGLVMLTDTRAARYWRVIGIGATLGYQWKVSTLELHVGLPDGTPTRISVGSSGQVVMVVGGMPSWAALRRSFGWYNGGALVVASDVGPNYIADEDMTILGLSLYAKIAPLTSAADFDVRRSMDNGATFTTIFSTRPTIAAGSKVGGSGAVLSISQLNTGDILRLDVIATGGTAASGVTAQLKLQAR